jgi:Cysteine-rich CPXCG
MELFQTVQCPFCGSRIEIGIDTTIGDQTFTTDCEVCCRPFEVVVECEPGEILNLEVRGD